MAERSDKGETADHQRSRQKPGAHIVEHLPGLVLVAVMAMSASLIADHYGGPVLPCALMIGVAMSAISGEPRFAIGLTFSADTFLPVAIALAGFGVTFTEIAALRGVTVAITPGVLATRLAAGLLAGRRDVWCRLLPLCDPQRVCRCAWRCGCAGCCLSLPAA